MGDGDSIRPIPWDSEILGMEAFEILEVTEESVGQALSVPGHYTAKVAPLSSKRLLHESGFYYCDTLVEPYCTPERFVFYGSEEVTVSRDLDLSDAIGTVRGSFEHGRFHRDFNVDPALADLRYERWLKDIYNRGTVLGFYYKGEYAGFFGYVAGRIHLHALDQRYRGRGLARYFWSAACKEMMASGVGLIESSVSASNMPAINLYCQLGFGFRNPSDVYHRVVYRT